MSLSPSSDRLAPPSTFSRARKSPFPLAPSPSSPILSDHLLLPAPSPPDLPSHLAPVFHSPLRKQDFVTRFPLPNIPLEYALPPNNPYWQVSVRLPQRRTNPFLDTQAAAKEDDLPWWQLAPRDDRPRWQVADDQVARWEVADDQVARWLQHPGHGQDSWSEMELQENQQQAPICKHWPALAL